MHALLGCFVTITGQGGRETKTPTIYLEAVDRAFIIAVALAKIKSEAQRREKATRVSML